MQRDSNASLRHYVLALGAVATALLLKSQLAPSIEVSAPSVLLLCAVFVSSRLGGLGPGLLATFAAAAASYYLLPRPAGGAGNPYLPLGLFVAEGAFITVFCATLRQARDELRESKAGLEAELKERMAALVRSNESLEAEIKERRQAEETLYQLAAIVESSEDSIIAATTDGIITGWNQGAERMYGYTAEEMIGKHISALAPPGGEIRIKQTLGRIRGGERVEHFETVRVAKDGRRIDVSLTVSPIKDAAGRTVGAASIARDIAERKRSETELAEARDSALAAARAKAAFLANTSHEIRTPMNGVIGMTGLLLDTELDPLQREFAESIKSSAHALLKIINDILDFSQIEAGKLRFEKLEFDPRASVESVVEVVAEGAQSKGVELISFVETEVPARLLGDPTRLRQVLVNLVGNAVKFTERGEVYVGARVERETASHVVLCFVVRDTGTGISREGLRQLFRPFTQADGSTTRRYGGTGLGLVISKHIVELLGGEISVESAEGQGSTFRFTAEFEKQHGAAARSSSGEGAALAGVRVLVVEDNRTQRETLRRQLRSWGARDGEASDGAGALAELRRGAATGEPYDIALLDASLPDVEDAALAREIKADASIMKTRIVLLVPLRRYHAVTDTREDGVAAWLMKPVKQSQLLNSLLAATDDGAAQEGARELSPSKRRRAEEPEDRGGSSARVLVVEDNPVNRQVVLYLLPRFGYAVKAVTNGREALDALDEEEFDLVMMDCQMPEMDGYEATAEIRRREAGRKHTPIIGVTAHAFEADRERCLAAGMDDYVAKPFKPATLENTLAHWLGARPARLAGTGAEVEGAGSVFLAEIMNESVLNHLREGVEEGDRDPVVELLGLFCRNTESALKTLKDALSKGDALTVERAAHSLKGSGDILGLQQLAAFSAELETKAHDNSLDGAEEIERRIEAELRRVREALENELARAAHVGA